MKSLNLFGLFSGSPADVFKSTLKAIPRPLECVYLLNPPDEDESNKETLRNALEAYYMQNVKHERVNGKKIVAGRHLSSYLSTTRSFSRSHFYMRQIISGELCILQDFPSPFFHDFSISFL